MDVTLFRQQTEIITKKQGEKNTSKLKKYNDFKGNILEKTRHRFFSYILSQHYLYVTKY